jgi:alkylated DNA repair protein alkB family protein 7
MGRLVAKRVGIPSEVSKIREAAVIGLTSRDKLRYEYEHAILGYDESEWEGIKVEAGHRVSIMVRDALRRAPQTAV